MFSTRTNKPKLSKEEYEDVQSLYLYIREMNLLYGKKNGMKVAMELWLLAHRTLGATTEEYNMALNAALEYDGMSDKESQIWEGSS